MDCMAAVAGKHDSASVWVKGQGGQTAAIVNVHINKKIAIARQLAYFKAPEVGRL